MEYWLERFVMDQLQQSAGSAIGVGGGLVAKQFLFQNNNITQRLKDGSRSLAGQPVQMRFEAKRYPINSNITHYCGIILMSYHFQ